MITNVALPNDVCDLRSYMLGSWEASHQKSHVTEPFWSKDGKNRIHVGLVQFLPFYVCARICASKREFSHVRFSINPPIVCVLGGPVDSGVISGPYFVALSLCRSVVLRSGTTYCKVMVEKKVGACPRH